MIHEAKEKVQLEAYNNWRSSGFVGTIAMATGTGKTRVALMAIKDLLDVFPDAKVTIVTPTETLRDEGWKKEFDKWGMADYYSKMVRLCYAALKNKLVDCDLLVLDEVHNMNINRYMEIRDRRHTRILGLTATPPKGEKGLLLRELAPIVYTYSLQEASDNDLVAPFDVTVIRFNLSVIPLTLYWGKNKKKTATEEQHYQRMCNNIEYKKSLGRRDLKFDYLRRQRFLYNIPSRVRLAEDIKNRHLDGHCSLIFAPSIDFAKKLSPNVYSSKGGINDYRAFLDGRINELATVRMLNEGHNLGRIDRVLIVAANSNAINLIQQIGRAIRKEGQHAKIYVLCAKNTKDEEWLMGSIADSGIQNVRYEDV